MKLLGISRMFVHSLCMSVCVMGKFLRQLDDELLVYM